MPAPLTAPTRGPLPSWISENLQSTSHVRLQEKMPTGKSPQLVRHPLRRRLHHAAFLKLLVVAFTSLATAYLVLRCVHALGGRHGVAGNTRGLADNGDNRRAVCGLDSQHEDNEEGGPQSHGAHSQGRASLPSQGIPQGGHLDNVAPGFVHGSPQAPLEGTGGQFQGPPGSREGFSHQTAPQPGHGGVFPVRHAQWGIGRELRQPLPERGPGRPFPTQPFSPPEPQLPLPVHQFPQLEWHLPEGEAAATLGEEALWLSQQVSRWARRAARDLRQQIRAAVTLLLQHSGSGAEGDAAEGAVALTKPAGGAGEVNESLPAMLQRLWRWECSRMPRRLKTIAPTWGEENWALRRVPPK